MYFDDRESPEKLFDVFTEIARPTEEGSDAFVLQQYPEHYCDEVTRRIISLYIANMTWFEEKNCVVQ